ncbi:UDP-N-acetylmuramoyl-L-alanyl-D-glutamate--2,6-diaminopimelate ligase [Pseudonocardiaceae bacterium YIM PH 21723]|nr:UDP-N-acetylmuramoyl-L-alanyl-D-glutamate--2,6-diaminopimelate ligase [Pseudonocardiaceae bacterium YIM PH 21723]
MKSAAAGAKNVAPPPRPSHVRRLALSELARLVGAQLVSGSGDVTVSGATLRAHEARQGDLFAALAGARAHGADFAEQAQRSGAVAVLTDEAGARKLDGSDLPVLVHENPRQIIGVAAAHIYGEPATKLAIWGITGTAGKTTTTYLINSALRAAGRTTGIIGGVETNIAGTRLDSAFTTPEAPDLQALLAVMLERGVTDVVMEVSSHALSLGRVAGVGYAVAGFTNLSQDHLDFHRDLEDYFAAKALLFDGRAATEVVCVDGDWGRRLVKPNTVTVSIQDQAAWTYSDRQVFPDGRQTFVAHGPDGASLPVTIRLPGDFNIANALLAIGCLHSQGVEHDAITAGLEAMAVPGRMERVAVGQEFTAVVDYAHKPGAVTAVLDAAREQATGEVIVVLGCGGDRDSGKRELMGRAAASRSQLLIVSDDNPRSEDPAAIRRAMLAGAYDLPAGQRGEVLEIGDRRQAIAEAVRRAKPGDIVVVAGKGHETGQEIQGVVQPFSDRDELTAAIKAKLEAGA